jgi:SAM-dependent methyltransferase
MSGQSSDELLQKLRSGELDARRLLVAPGDGITAGITIGELLEADPSIEIGERAWRQVNRPPATRIGDLDADHRAWIAELITFWRSLPTDVVRTTSPLDGMYVKTPDQYFLTGAQALRCVRLAMLDAGKESCASILDFACGYGRALRFFKAAFADAQLTACDITHEAVDFCAETLGAIPVYSHEDPQQIELGGPFDVIWVGSLFTHVSEPRWIAFLDLLESVLAPDGLLVFTSQGRNVRRQLVEREVDWPLGDDAIEQIVRGFDETGFGYADWQGSGDYGTSISRPSWVCAQIEQRPGLRLIGYRETGWGRQDVVACACTGT